MMDMKEELSKFFASNDTARSLIIKSYHHAWLIIALTAVDHKVLLSCSIKEPIFSFLNYYVSKLKRLLTDFMEF
jgi:hypothetical protein